MFNKKNRNILTIIVIITLILELLLLISKEVFTENTFSVLGSLIVILNTVLIISLILTIVLKKDLSLRIRTLDEILELEKVNKFIGILFIFLFSKFFLHDVTGLYIDIFLYSIIFVGILSILLVQVYFFKLFSVERYSALGYLIYTFLLFLMFKGVFSYHYGNEELGSLFEKSNYKTKYFVQIDNSDEVYPAEIEVFTDHYEEEIGDGNTRTFEDKSIWLLKLYYKNKVFYFEDCELEIDKDRSCKDNSENEWEITLTKNKVR